MLPASGMHVRQKYPKWLVNQSHSHH
jgi:hypothetical protein